MITRLEGELEAVADQAGVVRPKGAPGVAIEVLLPAYLAERLAGQVGRAISLWTLLYLEGQGQGTSFVPRLIGFSTPGERDFFELFTTVKGIGSRKALRAMAREPSAIAGAIVGREPKVLQELPEIGKRLAETIIAELSGKVEAFLGDGEVRAMDAAAAGRPAPDGPLAEQAIETFVALGETRGEAERLVGRALARAARLGRAAKGVDEIVSLVYAER